MKPARTAARINSSSCLLFRLLGLIAMLVLLAAPGSAADTDGDGMDDDYEVANGLAPLDPNDQLADPDWDRVPNIYESADGTLAGDGNRFFEIFDPFDPRNPHVQWKGFYTARRNHAALLRTCSLHKAKRENRNET